MNWTRIYPTLLQTPEAIAERQAVTTLYRNEQIERAATTYCAIRFGLDEDGTPRSTREAQEGLAATFAMLGATLTTVEASS